MPDARRISWSARLLAPLALVVVAIVAIVVVSGSLGGDDRGGADREPRGGNRAAQSDAEEDASDPAEEQDETEKTYVVEPGDSLSTIAEDQGVSVDELLELNPKVDPQALATGEELKLR